MTDALGNTVVAIADLVGRSGGTQFEIGYLEEDVPIAEARWYCQASFKGAKLIADEHKSPMEACDELARKILTGGRCQFCERITMVAADATDAACGWYRDQDRWMPGCAPGARAVRKRARR